MTSRSKIISIDPGYNLGVYAHGVIGAYSLTIKKGKKKLSGYLSKIYETLNVMSANYDIMIIEQGMFGFRIAQIYEICGAVKMVAIKYNLEIICIHPKTWMKTIQKDILKLKKVDDKMYVKEINNLYGQVLKTQHECDAFLMYLFYTNYWEGNE